MMTYFKLFLIEIENIISPNWSPFNWHHVCFSFGSLNFTIRIFSSLMIFCDASQSISVTDIMPPVIKVDKNELYDYRMISHRILICYKPNLKVLDKGLMI